MPSDDTIISVENLSKSYELYDQPIHRLKQILIPAFQKLLRLPIATYFKEFKALNNLSFEVKKGESIAIVGRNGSGKSTLLQIICGTLTPTEGAVKVRGRVAALLELGSGFNLDFTGRENIYMNAAILGLTHAEIEARYEDIKSFADIDEFIDQPVKTYSSGMVLRLAFSVIAHVDADILVIDEALAVGDIVFTQKCMRFIENFKKNKTLLFVSHDTSAVANISSKAIWLKQGKIQLIGSTSEVLDAYHADNISNFKSKKLKKESSVKDTFAFPDHLLKMNKINSKSHHVGEGRVSIISAFFSIDGAPCDNFCGGESVNLNYLVKANDNISGLLVGFTIKDKLGQKIIEDNNLSFVLKERIELKTNELLAIQFLFIMPTLKHGHYSIDLAVAEGDKDNYIHQSWRYDAIQIQMTPKDEVTGMVKLEIDSFDYQRIK